jgi:hypothetical protein
MSLGRPILGKPITIADCSEHRRLEEPMKEPQINLDALWPKLLEIAETRLVVRALVDSGRSRAVTVVVYTTHTTPAGRKQVGFLVYTHDQSDPHTEFTIVLGKEDDEPEQQWKKLVGGYLPSWQRKPAWCTAQQAAAVLQGWDNDRHELVHDSNLLMQVYRIMSWKLDHDMKMYHGQTYSWLETCQVRLSSFIFDCNARLARSGDLLKLKLRYP